MFEGARGLLKSPRLLVTAAIGALLLAGAVIVWTMPVSDEPAPLADTRPALPQPSIAVLPFSLSGDEQPVANLSAGMTAERSEEHTSELQSLMRISYAVFCLKKKNYTIQDSP